MGQFHYLGNSETNLARALQYVVEDARSGEWLALMDWGYSSLKIGVRDDWIGWDSELKSNRLRYIATNTRFLILPPGRHYPNLASQCLSLVTRRLSDDWAHYHGNHLLLAETFVDIERFAGTCYRAANWIDVGLTKGFGRTNKTYVEHGKPKRVFLFPLCRNAKSLLSSKGVSHMRLTSEREALGPLEVTKLPVAGKGGLLDAFAQVPDSRGAKGKRYSLSSILALATCAILSGVNSVRGIAEYGVNLPIEARRLLGFRRGKAPDEETVRLNLNRVDSSQFNDIVRDWIQKRFPSLKGRVIAIDGKAMRAARTAEGRAPNILSVVLHHDGVVLATANVSEKTNEIPVAQEVIRALPLKGTVVTLDALHTQRETARLIVQEKHSDYVMTVKANQEGLLEALERLPEGAFSPCTSNSG